MSSGHRSVGLAGFALATGILAAQGDNGIGISGVNWRTQILPERFWDTNGGSAAGAIAAIDEGRYPIDNERLAAKFLELERHLNQ